MTCEHTQGTLVLLSVVSPSQLRRDRTSGDSGKVVEKGRVTKTTALAGGVLVVLAMLTASVT